MAAWRTRAGAVWWMTYEPRVGLPAIGLSAFADRAAPGREALVLPLVINFIQKPHRPSPVGDAELADDLTDVSSHGDWRDPETLSDLRGSQSFAQQQKDIPLALRQVRIDTPDLR